MVIGRNDVKYTSIETLDIPELFYQIYIFVCQVDIGNKCSFLVHHVGLHIVRGVDHKVAKMSRERGTLSFSARSDLIYVRDDCNSTSERTRALSVRHQE